jgi:DNA-binding protein HU-beta
MAKQLTKSQLASELAEKTGITKKSADDVLNELATIAYREAENSFTIPGIGKKPGNR